MSISLNVTNVFERTWDAIHETDEDGSRKYRYIIHEGSSRSSKTYSLIDVCDLYCRTSNNKRVTVWRDTKTDCKKTVLEDIKKHLAISNRWLVNHGFNKTESILSYTTKSNLEIHGTDDDTTVHGLTQDVAWLNEPYKISEGTFNQIDQRTSDFIVVDWNPKMTHVWIDRLKKDPRSIVIKSTFLDNPFCPTESRNKILSYKPITYAEAYLNDIKTIEQLRNLDFDGLSEEMKEDAFLCVNNERKDTASSYMWSVYGLGMKAERPNRVFRNWTEIPHYEYQDFEEDVKLYGVDWGQVDPWGIVEAKYYDGAIYLHELNYLSENEIREKKLSREMQIKLMGEDDGLVKYWFNKLGVDPKSYVVCDNNRPKKVLALRQIGYEQAISARKGKIIDGIGLLNDIKVYITDTSLNLRAEYENYSYKEDRYGIVLEDPEDDNNHLMDPTRYIAEFLRYLGKIKKA